MDSGAQRNDKFETTKKKKKKKPERKVEPKKICPDGFVFVKGGEFWMGSTPEEIAALQNKGFSWARDEGPRRRVRVSDVCMEQHEVTNKEYDSSPISNNAERKTQLDQSPECKGDNKAAAFVLWKEAKDYCESKGWRLPTEAEWERGARGPSGVQVYPTEDGNPPTTAQANFGDLNNRRHPIDVGSFAAYSVSWPQPDGSVKPIFDMAGNVWEWVSDWYTDRYIVEPSVTVYNNPTGPQTGQYKVLRGGSWYSYYAGSLRAANRSDDDPDYRGKYVGFRCAVSVLPEDSPKK